MAKKKKAALDSYLADHRGMKTADMPGLVVYLKAERDRKEAEKDAEAEEVYQRWLIAQARRKEREASAKKENA